MTWREQSLEIIHQVIDENPGLRGKELRRVISEAYPFGSRSNFPYKAWLSAVEETIGKSEKAISALRRQIAEEGHRTGQGRLIEVEGSNG